jgi:hypothetical protein
MIREFDQDIEFLMIKVSSDIGYKFKIIDSLLVEPFFGFGYRRWLRDVEEFLSIFSLIDIIREIVAYKKLNLFWLSVLVIISIFYLTIKYLKKKKKI